MSTKTKQEEPESKLEEIVESNDSEQSTTPTTSTEQSTTPTTSTETNQDEELNILSISRIMANWCEDNDYLLKPTDVRNMYLLCLMEFIDKDHEPRQKQGEQGAYTFQNDKDIKVKRKRVERLLSLYFNKNYNQYFYRLSVL